MNLSALLIEDNDEVAASIKHGLSWMNITHVKNATDAAKELGFKIAYVDGAYEVIAFETAKNFGAVLCDNEIIGDISGFGLFKLLAQGYVLSEKSGLYETNFKQIPTIIKITSAPKAMLLERIGHYSLAADLEGIKGDPQWIQNLQKVVGSILERAPSRDLTRNIGVLQL